MDKILLISDAAKEVKVESHVLRYWEDELKLPIKRNELGHRYYTDEDVKRFKQIKIMKEQGLQLKAIKMILKDGKLNVVSFSGQEAPNALTGADRQDEDEINAGYDKVETQNGTEPKREMAITVVSEDEVEVSDGNPDARKEAETAMVEETSSEKAKRLQWLLQQLIRETLQENNRELSREIREGIIKEIDYQFRTQEEREEERERRQNERSEDYYKKMDEILRMKTAANTTGKNKGKIRFRKVKDNTGDKAAVVSESADSENETQSKKEEHKMIDMNDHKKKRKKFFL